MFITLWGSVVFLKFFVVQVYLARHQNHSFIPTPTWAVKRGAPLADIHLGLYSSCFSAEAASFVVCSSVPFLKNGWVGVWGCWWREVVFFFMKPVANVLSILDFSEITVRKSLFNCLLLLGLAYLSPVAKSSDSSISVNELANTERQGKKYFKNIVLPTIGWKFCFWKWVKPAQHSS